MASALHSHEPLSDRGLLEAINRMIDAVGAAENHPMLIATLAEHLSVCPDDQVFWVVADLEGQWKVRPATLISGPEQLDGIESSAIYDLASQAIERDELTVCSLSDTERCLAALPLKSQPNRIEALVAHVAKTTLPLLTTAGNLITQLDVSKRDAPGDSVSQEILLEMAAVIEAVTEIEAADSLERALATAAEFVAGALRSSLPSSTAASDDLTASVEVHLGMCIGHRGLQLKATSGGGKPDDAKRALIEAAMAETKARQGASQWPATTGNRYAALCLKALAEQSEHSYFYSAELTDHTARSVGVMIISTSVPIADARWRRLEAWTTPLGAALEVVQRAELNHVGKLIRSIADRWNSQRARMVAQIAAVLVALACIPMPYSVHSNSKLQPNTRRFVSVPFDAKLADCTITPGDMVEAGQELARLDEQEVRLELAQTEADLYRALKDQDGMVARHESGEAALAKLKADALAARQQLLRYRCDHLVMRSPIAGMVVAGDFKDAKGMPLTTGQSMFEIAQLDALRLEILIQAEEIHMVEEGAAVKVRFDALPFETFDLQLERINPASELRDGANVFVATALMPNRDHRLRPGMQGEAKIRSRWLPIGWHYLRKPTAYTLKWLGW